MSSDICLIVVAILIPPAAVAIKRCCSADLFLNIILTLLGDIPGMIHAIYIILRDRERRQRPAYNRPGSRGSRSSGGSRGSYEIETWEIAKLLLSTLIKHHYLRLPV
jgi:uncharacterized membrane protein YqaE (UPF0057 family)